ncbi:MAG: glycosyltransferase family 4 protein [Candidatus Buchananbacteria bacterium]|nr:glycosyltransferase family 4 protein [Candidatus Buchananbacteria bacterium]
MRIGIDARMYGPQAATGIGNYIKNLTQNLFAVDQTNEYFLFMIEPQFSAFTPPNERVKKIKVDSPWYSWSEQLKLPFVYRHYNLDILHVPHFNVPIFYPGKMVTSIHDITPKFFPGPVVSKSIIRKLGYNAVLRSAVYKSKSILVGSQHTKNEITKHFKVDESKIKVIPLGYDFAAAKQYLASPQQLVEKYKITKPFILYIGVWRDHKNLPGLITAFDIIKEKFGLDYQLVLGGKADPSYPEIPLAINKAKYRQDIIVPGYIPEDELPNFYQHAKVFVLPSFCEGFGLVALESATWGVPVAASNTTSVPEVLGPAGKYFNPHDPEEMARVVSEVATNENLHQNLVTLGYEQAKKYSWVETAKQTLAVYQAS